MIYAYLFSVIIFMIIFILTKKSDNILNFISWLVMGLVVIFCLNMFLVFTLYYIHIKSNYFILTIIYLSISGFLYYFKICNKSFCGEKNIQKYRCSFTDIVIFIIIFVVCISVGLIRFKGLKIINYNTVDPAVHHAIALKYSEVHQLLDSKNSANHLFNNFSRSMTGSYINGGIFINIFNYIHSHNAFIIYNTYTFLISAFLFYITCLEMNKEKHRLLLLILTCLYVFGYPLCEYLFGFYYLGIGVLLINSIILFFHFINENNFKIENKYVVFMLFLLNYALFFTYYLFVPFIYLAEGIYIFIKFLKKEWYIKTSLLYFFVTLVLPFFIGFCYFLLPGFLDSSKSDVSSITAEGAIYRSIISNFYIFIPLVIYYIYNEFKRKKYNYIFILLIVMILGLILLLFLGLKGFISSYYYYKFYYVLWLVVFLSLANLISLNKSNTIQLIYSTIVFIFLIFCVNFFEIESKIENKNPLFNSGKTSSYLVDIYSYNYGCLKNENIIYSNSDIDLVMNVQNKFKKCNNKNHEIPILNGYNQKFWFYSITGLVPTYNHKKKVSELYNEDFDYDLWKKDNNSDCLVLFYQYNSTHKNIDIDFAEYKVLYKNKSGVIIKKKY